MAVTHHVTIHARIHYGWKRRNRTIIEDSPLEDSRHSTRRSNHLETDLACLHRFKSGCVECVRRRAKALRLNDRNEITFTPIKNPISLGHLHLLQAAAAGNCARLWMIYSPID